MSRGGVSGGGVGSTGMTSVAGSAEDGDRRNVSDAVGVLNPATDGQPGPGANITTIQTPVAALAKTADGQHRVKVTAVGARPYPDPTQPSIPPTLVAECTFKVGSS